MTKTNGIRGALLLTAVAGAFGLGYGLRGGGEQGPSAGAWGFPVARAEGVAVLGAAGNIVATTNSDGNKLYLWEMNGGGRLSPAAWPPGAANEMHVIEFDFGQGKGLKKRITVQ